VESAVALFEMVPISCVCVNGIHRSVFFKVNITCVCLDLENNIWEQKEKRKFNVTATTRLEQITTFLFIYLWGFNGALSRQVGRQAGRTVSNGRTITE
jgi:hypothetical protein